jgi:hypothetical protein
MRSHSKTPAFKSGKMPMHDETAAAARRSAELASSSPDVQLHI